MKRIALLAVVILLPSLLYSKQNQNSSKPKLSTNKHYVLCKWVAPKKTTVTAYNIYRNDVIIASKGPQYRQYRDSSTVSGTAYTYYATAVVSGKESVPSVKVIVVAK